MCARHDQCDVLHHFKPAADLAGVIGMDDTRRLADRFQDAVRLFDHIRVEMESLPPLELPDAG